MKKSRQKNETTKAVAAVEPLKTAKVALFSLDLRTTYLGKSAKSGKLKLYGGKFADENPEEAARREVGEELRNAELSDLTYLGVERVPAKGDELAREIYCFAARVAFNGGAPIVDGIEIIECLEAATEDVKRLVLNGIYKATILEGAARLGMQAAESTEERLTALVAAAAP